MKTVDNRKILYLLGWCGIGGMVLLVLAENLLGISFGILWPPCLFHVLTGYYCPGCGGTRAFLSLLHGKLLDSLKYHPVVLYGAGLFFWFMGSSTLEYVSKGRYSVAMKFRKRYVVIALVLTAIHFLGVNGCLFFFGVDLLAK